MQLEKNLRQIARLIGEPVRFNVEISKGVLQIIAIDKLVSDGEYDESSTNTINKNIKINKTLKYIG